VLDLRRATVCIPSVLEVKTHFNFFFQFETQKEKTNNKKARARISNTMCTKEEEEEPFEIFFFSQMTKNVRDQYNFVENVRD